MSDFDLSSLPNSVQSHLQSRLLDEIYLSGQRQEAQSLNLGDHYPHQIEIWRSQPHKTMSEENAVENAVDWTRRDFSVDAVEKAFSHDTSELHEFSQESSLSSTPTIHHTAGSCLKERSWLPYSTPETWSTLHNTPLPPSYSHDDYKHKSHKTTASQDDSCPNEIPLEEVLNKSAWEGDVEKAAKSHPTPTRKRLEPRNDPFCFLNLVRAWARKRCLPEDDTVSFFTVKPQALELDLLFLRPPPVKRYCPILACHLLLPNVDALRDHLSSHSYPPKPQSPHQEPTSSINTDKTSEPVAAVAAQVQNHSLPVDQAQSQGVDRSHLLPMNQSTVDQASSPNEQPSPDPSSLTLPQLADQWPGSSVFSRSLSRFDGLERVKPSALPLDPSSHNEHPLQLTVDPRDILSSPSPLLTPPYSDDSSDGEDQSDEYRIGASSTSPASSYPPASPELDETEEKGVASDSGHEEPSPKRRRETKTDELPVIEPASKKLKSIKAEDVSSTATSQSSGRSRGRKLTDIKGKGTPAGGQRRPAKARGKPPPEVPVVASPSPAPGQQDSPRQGKRNCSEMAQRSSSPQLQPEESYSRVSGRARKHVVYTETNENEDNNHSDEEQDTPPAKRQKKSGNKEDDSYDESQKKKRAAGVYVCRVEGCTETATRPSDMRRHENSSVHNDILFGCRHCSSWIRRRDALKRHMKTRHNVVLHAEEEVPVRQGP